MREEGQENEENFMGVPSHTNQAKILDENILNELKEIMDDEFTEVLESYLGESLSLLSRLHESEDQNNDEMFIRALDSFCSSSAHIGAVVVSSLADRMKKMACSNRIRDARVLIPELETRYQETRAEIEKIKRILAAD